MQSDPLSLDENILNMVLVRVCVFECNCDFCLFILCDSARLLYTTVSNHLRLLWGYSGVTLRLLWSYCTDAVVLSWSASCPSVSDGSSWDGGEAAEWNVSVHFSVQSVCLYLSMNVKLKDNDWIHILLLTLVFVSGETGDPQEKQTRGVHFILPGKII